MFLLIGSTGGGLNWALMVTTTMAVCKPAIRSTASAVQMAAFHVLGKSTHVNKFINILPGDAFSPFLVGAISDEVKSNRDPSYFTDFTALQYGLSLCPLVSFIG